jgi:hypothetical protein
MRSRERSERQAEPELFPKPLCRKGASDPTDRREGGGASDFGITYRDKRSFYGAKRSKNFGGAERK